MDGVATFAEEDDDEDERYEWNPVACAVESCLSPVLMALR